LLEFDCLNDVTGKIPSSARLLLLGHRGARANKSIAENTLDSFDQALADGCDGFEFDVRMTADGEAVVCHDPKVGAVEIVRSKRSALPDLPRLDRVLKRYQRSAFLDIELKVAGLEKQVAELLRQYRIRRGFVVSSFLPAVLQNLRIEDQNMPLGLICETRRQLERWRELPVEYVIMRYSLAGQTLIREIHDAKKNILVWTVNDEAIAKKFAEWGVDGIISDDTRLLKRALPGI
jgi:glycerophosphoryl diester phosphodiesterase